MLPSSLVEVARAPPLLRNDLLSGTWEVSNECFNSWTQSRQATGTKPTPSLSLCYTVPNIRRYNASHAHCRLLWTLSSLPVSFPNHRPGVGSNRSLAANVETDVILFDAYRPQRDTAHAHIYCSYHTVSYQEEGPPPNTNVTDTAYHRSLSERARSPAATTTCALVFLDSQALFTSEESK